MEYVYDFLNFTLGWLPDVLEQFFAYCIEGITWGYFKLAEIVLDFAWDTGQVIIQDLQLSDHVNTAWTGLSQETRSVLGFFRIPECINILISFMMTKFVLKFIPFF